jgi:hypothetical protein
MVTVDERTEIGQLADWQRVWRDTFALLLPEDERRALAAGLRRRDPLLIAGAATAPLPLALVRDWPIEAADPLVYGAWQLGQVRTVGEAEELWIDRVVAADQVLGETAGCRHWLNWWDETPHAEACRALLAEVED